MGREERPASPGLPVACSATAHLRARLTCRGVYPWRQLSLYKVGIDQEARMFISLLRQTVCPSAFIHAINWSLCSLLQEQGDRPRKGGRFSWLSYFRCSSRTAATRCKIHARGHERPKQVTGKWPSDSAEVARGWGFGARTLLLTTQGVLVPSYEKSVSKKA